MPMLTIERERETRLKNKKEKKIDKTYRPPFLQLPGIFEKKIPFLTPSRHGSHV